MAQNHRRLVTVYDKSGKAYVVSHLNAHDMVAQLDYTYVPGKAFSPVDNAPFATPSVSRAVEARHIQSILDNVGTDGSMLTPDAEEDSFPATFDAAAEVAGPVEDTELPTVEAVEPVADEAVDDSVEAPKRRGRPPTKA